MSEDDRDAVMKCYNTAFGVYYKQMHNPISADFYARYDACKLLRARHPHLSASDVGQLVTRCIEQQPEIMPHDGLIH